MHPEDEETSEYLNHYGIKRRSGRYPWGSGDDPFQRASDFKVYLKEMQDGGMSMDDINAALSAYAKQPIKLSSTEFRDVTSIATEIIKAANQSRALQMTLPPSEGGRGMSVSEAARVMDVSGSTVRGWLAAPDAMREGSLHATADRLRAELDEKGGFIDVGKGTNLYLGLTPTKHRASLALLRDEGYEVHSIDVPQLGTDQKTTMLVLAKPGTTWRESYDATMRGDVMTAGVYTDDGGHTWHKPSDKPISLDSKRIEINYADTGGTAKDGVIEVRRGVPELGLGENNYAQVRVAVDETHYLKGMAMYADDLPPGVDVRFNSSKTKEQAPGKLDSLKPMERDGDGNIDERNPFGATTRGHTYVDAKGQEQTSVLRIVNEEGDWDDWSKNLSSQMLSKQPIALAKQQLSETLAAKTKDLQEIKSLTNPVVRKKLLEEYADGADSAATNLKAAHMPGQATHVILPFNNLRPTEIYAPNYENGTRVALIRYPHGGRFEIPSLVVNNNSRIAKNVIGDARDAVGIHHSVAEQLSGADFDGDTVIVIPNPDGRVKSQAPLEQLKGFDAKVRYAPTETSQRMSKGSIQKEMGQVSNLITDMTLHNAPDHEIARAVRHSMVVIDANKHGLNYKQSEQDHNIKELREKYQRNPETGRAGAASTIISRASSEIRVPHRRYLTGDRGVDPKTGERLYVETGEVYTTKDRETGEVTKTTPKETKLSKMEYVKDARELTSGGLRGPSQPMEMVYADHANKMKALANEARRTAVNTVVEKKSPSAASLYAPEVASLEQKLRVAQRNAPLERRAQVIGGAIARSRIENRPDWDKQDIKRARYQALDEARTITGASKRRIGSPENPLTEREWEAIQARAVAPTKLREILANADMDRVKTLATPRPKTYLSTSQINRMQALRNQGKTLKEISKALGIPPSTISDNLKS